jgi:heme-degrading monooxygenase HmoA
MYEIFTYGRWQVEPAKEDAFVAAWAEFAAWVSEQPGVSTVRVTRDIRNPGRFISFGRWDDAEAVRAFKSSPEFQQRIGRVVKEATQFEPTDLVTLVRAEGGTSETFTPPALEPIHAPTGPSRA